MAEAKGIITLMGSGELTTGMVELHKALLGRYGSGARAVFMDTPAGFQLNVDHLAAKAVAYFDQRVGHALGVASLPSADADPVAVVDACYGRLQAADYVLVGPGSPTYALRQWQATRVPEILVARIRAGACLVAASAAALTVGRLTLPVYEIYKVGQAPHWVAGLDLLAAFGLDWVVVPHWNNAEGGNHDTRYCFMGAPRLTLLEAQLPEGVTLVGLDEHTALVLDLAADQAYIRGLGRVTLRRNGVERILEKEAPIPISWLRGAWHEGPRQHSAPAAGEASGPEEAPANNLEADPVWPPLEALAEKVHDQLAADAVLPATQSLLALEAHIHRYAEALQERNGLAAAREVLRQTLLQFGGRLAAKATALAPMVAALLELRARLRARKEWAAADAIRDCLQAGGVIVEDSPEGALWHLDELNGH
ncbi:MAG: Type 1 glutamine amidotransferase-like domain-containing protein [Desulfobacterales bacterium]|nr:Type 1 glutamine amidotransferase-like domain-containing protein [Desulfobacterales bacterium]